VILNHGQSAVLLIQEDNNEIFGKAKLTEIESRESSNFKTKPTLSVGQDGQLLIGPGRWFRPTPGLVSLFSRTGTGKNPKTYSTPPQTTTHHRTYAEVVRIGGEELAMEAREGAKMPANNDQVRSGGRGGGQGQLLAGRGQGFNPGFNPGYGGRGGYGGQTTGGRPRRGGYGKPNNRRGGHGGYFDNDFNGGGGYGGRSSQW
jgi:hypothetical protein